jgi:translation initiation factor 2B subunit (eIF-2B alpha/beta/delta family)/8-oxo-dGTP pyrophosphatase MutT (NUDIX family)
MQFKHVVSSFLQSDQRILILRRSDRVGSYRGRWSGVSGYLEEGEEPLQRAKIEIQEELGLSSLQVSLVRSGEQVRTFDEQKDTIWIIHPFLFEVHEPNLRLDWENSESRWIGPNDLRFFDSVPNLKEVFERVRWDLRTTASTLFDSMRSVNDLGRDRVHGASFLGRRSIEILAEVARVSKVDSIDALFSNLLSIVLELRKVQRNMATIRNLTGRFLFEAEAARQTTTSLDNYRETVTTLAQKAQTDAEATAEDASRNTVPILPEEGHVLTHSNSSTVRRALELAVKSKRKLTVYVIESSPGLEGKQLAKDLIGIGVPVKLIADSAVNSVISDIDMVIVGADSVLANGSVINKIGTSKIANVAKGNGIPFCAVCESAKFSAADFLGEQIQIAETVFDLTPAEYVSKVVTELGPIEPGEVEPQIRNMLSQLYP